MTGARDDTDATGLGAGMALRPHHVGLSVADLGASVAWYRDNLGFAVEERGPVPDGEGRMAMLTDGGFRMELFEVAGAAPLPEGRGDPAADLRTHGVKHLAFEVDDVAALVARLRSRGVDVVWEVEHAGHKVAFVRDNTGNLVEFLQPS
jgi:methylmalonyl-CoA/ethylmalonyl-CoA epimerase